MQFLRGGRSSLRTRRSCWVTVSSSTVSLTETRRLSSRGTKTTVRPSHCQQHRTTGVNHVEEGRGERRVPENLQYGRTLMQIIPPVFQKYRSGITKTRHFKRKIHFFLGRGLSLCLGSSPMDSTLAPNQAFWIDYGSARLSPEFQPYACVLSRVML